MGSDKCGSEVDGVGKRVAERGTGVTHVDLQPGSFTRLPSLVTGMAVKPILEIVGDGRQGSKERVLGAI